MQEITKVALILEKPLNSINIGHGEEIISTASTEKKADESRVKFNAHSARVGRLIKVTV